VFVARRIREAQRPSAAELATAGIVLAIPLACLFGPAWCLRGDYPWWLHSWVHSGTIYLLANGSLAPEETHLAGVSQSYPWAAHIFQGLVSRLLDRPPAVTYLALNAVWLGVITAFVGGLVRDLGGRFRGQIAACALLWFGVNFVGYLCRFYIFGPGWETEHFLRGEIFGDVRYTPFLWKFRFLEHVIFGLAMFAAMPHFLARLAAARESVAQELLVLFLLLAGVVLVYPVLAPISFALVGGSAAWFAGPWRKRERLPFRRLVLVGAVIGACGLIGMAYFRVLMADRAYGTGGIASPREIARKLVQSIVVALPLIAGAVLYLRAHRRELSRTAWILLAGTCASFALYALMTLPAPNGEYKYVFTAAICLAPLAGAALEPWLARTGRAFPAIAIAATLVLAAPFAQKIARQGRWPPGDKPELDLAHFQLDLAPTEPGAALYRAVRERTPADAILVVDAPRIDVAALTRRSVYLFDDGGELLPGIMLLNDELVGVSRGHDRRIVRERTAVQNDLYRGSDDAKRAAAVGAMLALKRPLVVLLDRRTSAHLQLAEWLGREPRAHRLAQDGELEAWGIETVAQ
jgi:hypothetical protein